MKRPLHIIHEKISAIGAGLLRYRQNDKKITLHSQIVADSNEELHCTINEKAPEGLLNREVTLVQKEKNCYIYVDGKISRIVKGINPVIYIKVKKACWFERKRKGSVTSLLEKSIYEMPVVKLAS